MERQIYGTRDNILTLLVWMLIWFGFGFIYSLLAMVSDYLKWIFIILTAGYFFFAGGNFVDQGAFNNVKWKIFFVLIAPIILMVDLWLNTLVSWYNGVPGFAYYCLYTLGFLFKKIPDPISRMIQIMKQIEPGYKEWDNDNIKEQIKAIEKCGYKWHEKKGRVAFRHEKSKLLLKIPNLNYYSPEKIIKTYEEIWSKEGNMQESINNENTMIIKIWRDFFCSSEMENLSAIGILKADIDEIITLFVKDKIDPQKFFPNIEALLTGGMSFNFGSLKTPEDFKPTKSISLFTSWVNRPSETPLWFLAGYPDVMQWLNIQQKNYLKLHNHNIDGWEIEMSKLFKLNYEDENQIINEGRINPKYYKNLTAQYKKITKKKFETELDKDSENKLHIVANMLDNFGTESQFILIAENTTKFYLELKKSHRHRFVSEISLLATSGVLDAQWDVLSGKLAVQQILKIAEKATKFSDPLFEFILLLEPLLFKIENQKFTLDEIEDAVNGQSSSIQKSIQKIINEYQGEYRFFSDVSMFMKSPKFRLYREVLGIKE